LASVERLRCSNEAKTQKPLKFAGVPQARQSISTAIGPKFTILWGHLEAILLVNIFFQLSIHALVARIQHEKKICNGEQMVIYLRPVFSASLVQRISDMH